MITYYFDNMYGVIKVYDVSRKRWHRLLYVADCGWFCRYWDSLYVKRKRVSVNDLANFRKCIELNRNDLMYPRWKMCSKTLPIGDPFSIDKDFCDSETEDLDDYEYSDYLCQLEDIRWKMEWLMRDIRHMDNDDHHLYVQSVRKLDFNQMQQTLYREAFWTDPKDMQTAWNWKHDQDTIPFLRDEADVILDLEEDEIVELYRLGPWWRAFSKDFKFNHRQSNT